PTITTWADAAYGALAHDIGKIVVDLQVELQDGSTWHPWNGPINQPYRFKYVKSREYQLHGAASALLIHQLLPRPAPTGGSLHADATPGHEPPA
ncbi:TraI domain-containing protein, partial [Pseudomonas aeruginosa]|uniref:TraI domain-containing protein n=1 Tax=Pseudomonas aeruginosa TaxID=287 RepID=UPI003D18AFDC